ncbi:uncharacterized protein LOC135114955 isoform X2 [Scylla paramamosain]|uniref:uncharacterized protein LOC135114955 isoform X2 n=1 Tax=Scylla paramamosain TaxID=85552 RepID=UPI003082ABC3
MVTTAVPSIPTMPLTLTYALLGVSCACILFGNSSVNADSDKLQIGQGRKPPDLIENPPGTTSTALKRPKKSSRKSYNYPVKYKGKVRYYDLGGVNDTKLDILDNIQDVKGITASHGDCKIQSLYLGTNYLLDEELITYCPHLSLRLKGDKWLCLQDGLMLHRRGVEVNMTEANCNDAWLDKPHPHNSKIRAQRYSMAESIRNFIKFDINSCPAEKCICKWYFKDDSYTVNVDCDDVGLTDDMLPTLPDKVKDITLKKNKLRSMDTLIKHLLPHNLTLQRLNLDDNLIEELPHFSNETFPNIVHLALERNEIKKIDIEVFKELITRKDLIISLIGNTFPCDCNLYNFKVFLQENYLRHWSSFQTYMDMECENEGQDKKVKKVKMHSLSEELCKTWLDGWQPDNWWWVINFTLGALNVVVIVLIVDLICILKRVGCKRERVPLMGRLMYQFGIAHQKLPTNEDSENGGREENSLNTC